MTDTAVDLQELQDLLRDAYTRATEPDAEYHPTKKVPDFRVHDGVQVEKYSRLLTIAELVQTPQVLADALCKEIVDYERREVNKVGDGCSSVARVFLKGFERPCLLEDGDRVKLRHVFGAVSVND